MDGAFLKAMIRGLVETCERYGMPLAKRGRAVRVNEPASWRRDSR